MTCIKCGSDNVSVQVINEQQLVNKHHGLIWWIFIGFWWVPIKWLFLTVPALIFAIFGRKKQRIKNTQKSIAVCQNCGNKWDV